MDWDEFARERLGWWMDGAGGAFVVDPTRWAQLVDPASVPVPGTEALALDVELDQRSASICVAGLRADGKVHGQLTGTAGELDQRDGIAWVPQRLAAIQRGLKARGRDVPVVIAAGSQAEGLVPALTAAGVTVHKLPGQQVQAACSQFVAECIAGNLRHLGQGSLDAAVMGALKRNVGDNAFVFARRKGARNISSLYALAEAIYGAQNDITTPVPGFYSWNEL